MHDILAVEVVTSFQQLIDEEPNGITIKTVWLFFENFKQVSIHKFKHEVKSALSIIMKKIGKYNEKIITYRLNASIILTT